ncbi:hypothetical protein GWK47_037179 [Chionoecetes opilio]|uniref:Uncharacterized protein n=1 Tax=Chionoecetes opilio TaxID=41210 RepID=A0A8J4YDN6_CHIOP|nr:hypothetical protein GWK47_037179 [Chionoecetes opilio]
MPCIGLCEGRGGGKMSDSPHVKMGFAKDKWRLAKRGSHEAAKSDEDIIRAVLAKFHFPKKEETHNPYVPPPEQELLEHSGQSGRQLLQDLAQSGKAPLVVSQVRKANLGRQRDTEPLGPPKRGQRSGRPSLQPLTPRDYLSSARATARDQNLARVAEVESRRLEEELQQEKATNTQLETQLTYHEAALQEFLQYHYNEVTETMTRGDAAQHNTSEQEIRLDYYSGLLSEAKTVQEEEEERLQELTAFQQFLAAVTPSQSLRDLKRKTHEILEKVKESSMDASGRPLQASYSAELARAVTLATTDPSQAVSPRGEGGAGGTLGADLSLLRMLRTNVPQTRSSSGVGGRHPYVQAAERSDEVMVTEEEEDCDHGAFDEFLDDDEHLVELASMYECQGHALLALLTRIQNQTEALNKEVDTRQKKLHSRLQEIEQLQEKARGGGHEGQLQDLQALIAEWPGLSGDGEAQAQLDQLVAQIAEVVSDVFGASQYSPLVPQTLPEVPPLSKKSTEMSIKIKGGGGSEERSSPGQDSPAEARPSEATVAAGMGQEALLALLEARVTDLCAQLDNIDPALRDAIFLNCEQSRQARLKEEKRQEAEVRRAERKQRHLERALAEPPARPL